ncbi:hypothetical protein [Vibrio atypicus]|uniref:hypothetical protein n=1 Tax=Vibrio atypicus TaxID=558271 RepID=UPI001356F1F2|nr:hypothetical protein [Vibrio atypicus]
MTRKLIIHPGIGKTATSAVQYGLFENSNFESDNTIYIYPNVGLDSEHAHHYFADNYPGFSAGNIKDNILQIKNEVCAIGNEKNVVYILSSEFLVHSSQAHIDFLLSEFKSFFDSVEVVFSVRNYVDLVYSSYLQAVKVNYGIINSESILDYYSRMGDGFNFPVLLDKFSKYDCVKFIDYDKNKMDFIRVFFSSIGFDSSKLKIANNKKNLSIIEDVVDIIFSFDKLNDKTANRQTFISNMVAFSNNYKDFSSRKMKEQLIEKIGSIYESDLRCIREKYVEL